MRKIFTLAIAVTCFCHIANAQNLLVNGSFEDHTTCPHLVANYCPPWYSATWGSTQYYDSCDNFAGKYTHGTPDNHEGNQLPADGHGYAGMIIEGPEFKKDYPATSFSPLAPGTNYEISFSVSLVETSKFAADNLGVYFFKKSVSNIDTNADSLTVVPQVSFKSLGPIKDYTNWTRLSQTFTADIAYDHLVIGGFFKKDAGDFVKTAPGPGPNDVAFYYLDSVVLSVATGIGRVGNDMPSVNIYPNPNDGHFTIRTSSQTSNAGLSPLKGGSVEIEVFNAVGQRVYSKEVKAVDGKIDEAIDLGNVASGVYMVKVGSVYVRVVKE